jgi:hypothetical protein
MEGVFDAMWVLLYDVKWRGVSFLQHQRPKQEAGAATTTGGKAYTFPHIRVKR